MAVERGLFDDDSDVRYYTHPERGSLIYTSHDLHELTLAERHRLQRLDPDRPWLIDGLAPKGSNSLTNLRRVVYIRDNFTCQSCGTQFICDETLAREDFHYDGKHNVLGLTLGHVIPKSRGGPMTAQNIKAQCAECNERLGDNVWTEFI